MASLKDAQAVLEAGLPEGWGSVVEVIPKFNKFGLGFSPHNHSMAPQAPNLSTPVRFARAGLNNGRVNVVDDAASDYDIDKWIRPSVPGVELNNWTSGDVILVTLVQE